MGQLVRQGLRAVAIYFSDVLLWLSVAGILEVLFFLVAGALCILTAGFVFDSMKRSPIVLVLGSIVALTGTFLVFREVRGMIWPEAPAQQELVPQPAPPEPRPAPSGEAQPVPSPKPGRIIGSPCSGRPKILCKTQTGCLWSYTFDKCIDGLSPPSASKSILPSEPVAPSLCNAYTKLVCLGQSACYWSPLTDRCEKLLFGTRLGLGSKPHGAAPAKPSCPEISRQSVCLTTAGCMWMFDRCYPSSLPGSRLP
jgi:hypothetical protein